MDVTCSEVQLFTMCFCPRHCKCYPGIPLIVFYKMVLSEITNDSLAFSIYVLPSKLTSSQLLKELVDRKEFALCLGSGICLEYVFQITFLFVDPSRYQPLMQP